MTNIIKSNKELETPEQRKEALKKLNEIQKSLSGNLSKENQAKMSKNQKKISDLLNSHIENLITTIRMDDYKLLFNANNLYRNISHQLEEEFKNYYKDIVNKEINAK